MMKGHNKALHRTAIPLRSIAAGELGRSLLAPLGGNAELSRELLFPSLRSGEQGVQDRCPFGARLNSALDNNKTYRAIKKAGLMLSKMAHWLHNRSGFWFPAVTWLLDRLFRALSLGHLFNELLKRKSLGGPWVSELYQLLWVLLGLCWISLIERPVPTATCWIVIGLVVVFYRIFEILLFGLHWLLVAEGPVESYRRSLLGFLINLFELGIFFAIAYLLLGWFDPPKSAWSALFESVRSVFSLELVSGLPEAVWPRLLARSQLGISWILVVFVVAKMWSEQLVAVRSRKRLETILSNKRLKSDGLKAAA